MRSSAGEAMIARALENARTFGREHPETLTMAIIPPEPDDRCAWPTPCLDTLDDDLVGAGIAAARAAAVTVVYFHLGLAEETVLPVCARHRGQITDIVWRTNPHLTTVHLGGSSPAPPPAPRTRG